MIQTRLIQLRLERERRGWSRRYIAEQVEVDIATVGRWERGERLPYPHHRQKLCVLFELSALDLGFLSESGELLAEKSGDEIARDREDGQLSAPQENLDSITDPNIPVPLLLEKRRHTPSKLFRDRRRLLVGLGVLGVGATALLAGGGSMLHSHSFSSAAPSILIRRPLLHLTDTTTSNWINNLVWAPDGNMLAAAYSIPRVAIWDTRKGALSDSYATLNQWVNDVAWSNANRIAAAIADGLHLTGSVQIWAFPQATSPSFTLSRTYPLRTVSWSPDGEYLAFAGHSTIVEIWGPISTNPISRSIDAGSEVVGINRLTWSADGTYLAAAADNGTVHIWDSTTGDLKQIYRGHRERVVDIMWSPRGHRLASSSVDRTARIWDALSNQTLITYRGHAGEVHGIDWSPDGKYVVSAGYDATAQIWETSAGKHIVTYDGLNSEMLCARWSVDGRTIACGSKKQGLGIWQAPS